MKIKEILTSKKLIAFALVGILSVGQVAPAFASSSETEVTGSSTVNVTTNAVTVNMTVPTSADFVFNADGSTTVPTEWNIENNNSYTDVKLSEVNLTGDNSWKIANADESLELNQKAIKLKVGAAEGLKQVVPTNATTDTTGKATFGALDFVIPKSNQKALTFNVTRPDFSKSAVSEKAYTMNLVFDLSK